ncbi:Subtilase family protein [Geodermatophilus telluris]|uniref:Subtilase family protein n=1 Tax=Geodermatophilus telluris TaxID=1190417 RepID=A0A1G6V2T4_9ACTN|nr:S8 family peptidase [Geodermatophilus telluris]SDD47246.1 Subtilase family protein [Geodermatophilus telluris]
MSYEPDRRTTSPLIGDLHLPPDTDDEALLHDRVPALVELNVMYPGGLVEVAGRFCLVVWERDYRSWAGEPLPPEDASSPQSVTEPRVPAGLRRVTPKLYQCVLTRPQLRALVAHDRRTAASQGLPPTVFKVWPDYQLQPQIDRSAPTVKADAAWRSYSARGRGVVWAVLDSGIDQRHGHFAALELAREGRDAGRAPAGDGDPGPPLLTAGLHRDFRDLVVLKHADAIGEPAPLEDDLGHGTHVAGIIAGCTPADRAAVVASSEEPTAGGYVQRRRVQVLSGMAPECELVSLRVLRRTAQGDHVTSSAALIAALHHLRHDVNVDPNVLRVHGVNISLGCPWEPRDYAAGRSPLCQAVDQLVDSGVVVVVSAGNSGAGDPLAPRPVAALGSVTEPAHAENCIAVGSTHREAPHAFGITWTSSKGPTLDGRVKPDVVAPGEWITSAATGTVRARAGLPDDPEADPDLCYAEQSGTSMAAPHVSGVIAAFLSARPEFTGRPRAVKELLMRCATDLGRERYAQGAGLVDLMRMLSNV